MASLRYRSKAIRLTAILLVLVLAAVLLAPYLLSLDRYRALVVEQLERATGRDIEIEKLRLHLLPRLRVQGVNFQVKNPRGFPSGDTLAIERIDIGLALGPLLRREVEVDSVTFRSVRLNLLENERGQTNYDTLAKLQRASRGRNAGPPGKAAVSLTRVDTIALRDVSVSSGTFRRRHKRIHSAWRVSGINLEARRFDFSHPKWLRKVEAEVDLSKSKFWAPGWKQPLRFSGGALEVKENAAVGEFTLALGSLRARGKVKVANLERPVADFTLAMKELGLAEVNAALGGGAPSGPRSSSGRGGGRRLLARGTVRVDAVRVPPLRAQNLHGKVRLYSHRLEVDPFTLGLYGGRTRGSLQVNLTQASLPAQVRFTVKGVNVAQAIAAASPQTQRKMTGTFEAQGSLAVPLGADNPLAGLSGQGTFAVRDGTFPGLNLEGKLAKMAKFLQMDLPSGDTRFRFLGGDFRIRDRRVHSRILRLQAETLEASLRGSFGFDQTLSYSGSGVLTGKGTDPQEPTSRNPLSGLRRVFGKVMQETVGGGRVPFIVRGTFQEPKFILSGSPQPLP